MIFIANGSNDSASGVPPATIAAAQTTYIQTLRASFPYTPIIVLGIYPHNGGGTACGACVAAETAEQAAANAMNDPYLLFCPWVGDPAGSWETGTGSIASPVGDGNSDYFFEAIGHPNALGNRTFASRIVKCMRNWLTAKGYN